MLEYYKSSDITEGILNELKMIFPTVIKTADLKIDDDINSDSITVTHSFDVDGFWKDGEKEANPVKGYWIFRYEPLPLYQYLNVSACEDRRFDFALNYPLNFNYHVIFHFPKDMMVFDDYKVHENNAFYFEEKVEQLSSSSVQFDYVFRTKSDYIKGEDFRKICDQRNAIAKKLPIVLYFPK
jgi:hypothetical protein